MGKSKSRDEGTSGFPDGVKFTPWIRKTPWRKEWQLNSVFLRGEFLKPRDLADTSLTASDTTGATKTREHTGRG